MLEEYRKERENINSQPGLLQVIEGVEKDHQDEKKIDTHVEYCKDVLDKAKIHREVAEREEQANKQRLELARQVTLAEEARRKAEERAAAKKANEKSWEEKLARKASNKLQNELVNMGVRGAKKLLKNLLK